MIGLSLMPRLQQTDVRRCIFIMDIMLKILITQMVILVCSHFSMHPDSPIADYIEKVFGDYGKALNVVNGSQCILIAITLVVCLWRC